MHMEDLHQLSSFSSLSQESGWSAYLDDFYGHSSIQLPGGSSSTVSDAASSAARKPNPATGEPPRSRRTSNSKKKKGREVLVDNSLEDTASSAVNDNKPKGEEKCSLDRKTRKGRNSKGKSAGYVDCEEQGREGIKESDYVGSRVKDECSGLRARGLCLVPLSMLSNYLG